MSLLEKLSGVENNEKFHQKIKECLPEAEKYQQVIDTTSLNYEYLKDKKLFLFRLPKKEIDLNNLVGKKLSIGGSKKHSIGLADQEFNIESVPLEHNGSAALFIANRQGKLCQVDVPFESQVIVRKKCKLLEPAEKIDITKLCKVVHKPPKDIKVRSFYEPPSSDSLANKNESRKKKRKSHQGLEDDSEILTPNKALFNEKRTKNNVKLEQSLDSDEELVHMKKKKANKKRKADHEIEETSSPKKKKIKKE